MNFEYYVFINLTSAICCFLFLIFLFITYFSKKNMKNIENAIYRQMLIANGLCLIFYILSYCSFIYYSYEAPLALLFSKIAPIFLALWSLLISFYVIVITNEYDKKKYNFLIKNHRKIMLGIYIFTFIVSIVTFLEKVNFDYKTGVETNSFVMITIIFYAAFISLSIVIFIRRKRIDRKKAIPLYLIILISLIATGCAIFNVKIVLMFGMVTMINHLMYHTIENPDMKLVNELTLAKEQAEKASNAKSDFLSSMSHELRTPLNSIIGLTDVMSDCYDVEEMHNDLKDISQSSRKLLELVDGILTINTLDSNNVQIENSEYNLRSLLDDINNSISIRIGDKPIEFRKNYSSNLPNLLYGDKNKVKTIINNLISNAIKYTDEGIVELNVDSTFIKDKCNLKITVKDTGKGIKQEDIDNIFHKFYRSDDNKDSDISGTGLGLSITKSLVELMDGKITVESKLGEGTTFIVLLNQKVIVANTTDIESEIL